MVLMKLNVKGLIEVLNKKANEHLLEGLVRRQASKMAELLRRCQSSLNRLVKMIQSGGAGRSQADSDLYQYRTTSMRKIDLEAPPGAMNEEERAYGGYGGQRRLSCQKFLFSEELHIDAIESKVRARSFKKAIPEQQSPQQMKVESIKSILMTSSFRDLDSLKRKPRTIHMDLAGSLEGKDSGGGVNEGRGSSKEVSIGSRKGKDSRFSSLRDSGISQKPKVKKGSCRPYRSSKHVEVKSFHFKSKARPRTDSKEAFRGAERGSLKAGADISELKMSRVEGLGRTDRSGESVSIESHNAEDAEFYQPKNRKKSKNSVVEDFGIFDEGDSKNGKNGLNSAERKQRGMRMGQREFIINDSSYKMKRQGDPKIHQKRANSNKKQPYFQNKMSVSLNSIKNFNKTFKFGERKSRQKVEKNSKNRNMGSQIREKRVPRIDFHRRNTVGPENFNNQNQIRDQVKPLWKHKNRNKNRFFRTSEPPNQLDKGSRGHSKSGKIVGKKTSSRARRPLRDSSERRGVSGRLQTAKNGVSGGQRFEVKSRSQKIQKKFNINSGGKKALKQRLSLAAGALKPGRPKSTRYMTSSMVGSNRNSLTRKGYNKGGFFKRRMTVTTADRE